LNAQPHLVSAFNNLFFARLQGEFPRESRKWVVYRNGFGQFVGLPARVVPQG
jgi:hypothetical protein